MRALRAWRAWRPMLRAAGVGTGVARGRSAASGRRGGPQFVECWCGGLAAFNQRVNLREGLAAEIHMALAHTGLLAEESGANERFADLHRVVALIGRDTTVEVVDGGVVVGPHFAHA